MEDNKLQGRKKKQRPQKEDPPTVDGREGPRCQRQAPNLAVRGDPQKKPHRQLQHSSITQKQADESPDDVSPRTSKSRATAHRLRSSNPSRKSTNDTQEPPSLLEPRVQQTIKDNSENNDDNDGSHASPGISPDRQRRKVGAALQRRINLETSKNQEGVMQDFTLQPDPPQNINYYTVTQSTLIAPSHSGKASSRDQSNGNQEDRTNRSKKRDLDPANMLREPRHNIDYYTDPTSEILVVGRSGNDARLCQGCKGNANDRESNLGAQQKLSGHSTQNGSEILAIKTRTTTMVSEEVIIREPTTGSYFNAEPQHHQYQSHVEESPSALGKPAEETWSAFLVPNTVEAVVEVTDDKTRAANAQKAHWKQVLGWCTCIVFVVSSAVAVGVVIFLLVGPDKAPPTFTSAITKAPSIPPSTWPSSSPTFARVVVKTREELKDMIRVYMISVTQGLSPDFPPMGTWDVSEITDMSGLFRGSEHKFMELEFNEDISSWNVSRVTRMSRMFELCRAFNQSLRDWDTSKVESMASMFVFADTFNGDVGGWSVSRVKIMSSMFMGASSFNEDLSRWDVSRVSSMYWMFYSALNFNGDVGHWNVSQVVQMVV